jgi:hypothetical protein
MARKPYGPIRRSQLIVPFGTGAIVNVPGGTSLVVGGLDFWFPKNDLQNSLFNENEFRIEEWRLQKRLKVDHFRLPPDYRESRLWEKNIPNTKLTIPSFRFPTWHYCPICRSLSRTSPFDRGYAGNIKCKKCESDGKNRYMDQVRFIAICQNGHLNEFPWNEWVHKSINPGCSGDDLKLISRGTASLAGQVVRCNTCKAVRTLGSILSSHSPLSQIIANDGEYTCPGGRPWLGPEGSENCNEPLRGALRSALNVYYPKVTSSIYLPRSNNNRIQKIISLFENPPYSNIFNLLKNFETSSEKIYDALYGANSVLLSDFTKEEIIESIEIGRSSREIKESDIEDFDTKDFSFRRQEYSMLQKAIDTDVLTINQPDFKSYGNFVQKFFGKIFLVERLKETRVLTGFSRLLFDNDPPLDEQKSLLWKDRTKINSWLPATVVFGEGIFIEFNEDMLQTWENHPGVKSRLSKIINTQNIKFSEPNSSHQLLSPRYFLIHTFSHLLMTSLTYECGYSTASLRERLYISNHNDGPMAGMLIYTAAGDTEGSLGGLVRMGKPGYLENVIQNALERAKWCSLDPICMEIGAISGNSEQATNLAACYSCALVPETSCEDFNRFLDRGVVIGDNTVNEIGYFQQP